MRSFVLRFISGKYQGGEFPIATDKQIVVGRSSDLDMVLVEDMVSRKHARIAMQGDQIWIEDLGSTNGTFVNGEKIKRARLKEGDRVLIGTSILKVIAGDAPRERRWTRSASSRTSAHARRTSQQRTMSGSIEEVPLPDLLQLFGTSKKSGVLVIRTDDDVGRIYLRKGMICLRDHQRPRRRAAAQEPLPDAHLAEGALRSRSARRARVPERDERVACRRSSWRGCASSTSSTASATSCPTLTARISVNAPLIPPLRDLKPEELDVLQLAHNYGVFETVLNKSLATDLETAEILLKLIKATYLRVD